jgi:hypothetical protein
VFGCRKLGAKDVDQDRREARNAHRTAIVAMSAAADDLAEWLSRERLISEGLVVDLQDRMRR